jgi:hypothetical protein
MGSRITRLLARKDHLDKPHLQSRFNFWIKRLVLGFGATTMAIGVFMIIWSLMPYEDLLNLSLTARTLLDEAQTAFVSVALSDYDIEDPVIWFIGLILSLTTLYAYWSIVLRTRRVPESGITSGV